LIAQPFYHFHAQAARTGDENFDSRPIGAPEFAHRQDGTRLVNICVDDARHRALVGCLIARTARP
jgi:hypothetical protein